LREKRTPEKYVRIIKDKYEKVTMSVRSSVGLTEQIPMGVGLHQGSTLSPYLVDFIIDVLTQEVRKETLWCTMFADDVVLCGENAEEMEVDLEKWRKELEEKGLRINRSKTVQINFGSNQNSTIHIEGEELKKVEKFKYLGSTIDNTDY